MTTIPDWDDYFLGIAHAASKRGKCTRRQVGAVIVGQDKRILATGYNGSPEGTPGCLEGACPRGKHNNIQVRPSSGYDTPGSHGYCTAIHAELNALLHCHGRPVGSTVYITHDPCPNCIKHLAGAGITRALWVNPDNTRDEINPAEELYRLSQLTPEN